ncbi:HET-domain-containing protein [Hypoxylon rubiginosum]|uniref:HET-domain-containing protein n=1 Tax=Hypoxylon rubiginosum TaxID=110542 RepID=A0ACC0DCE0_9PEZI|nr:HET-domain-containing protein [Hypoxylon rubiginosum]
MADESHAAEDTKLCAVCSGVDIASYFKEEKHSRRDESLFVGATSDAFKLGYLRDILLKAEDCSFCRIVVEAICTTRSASIDTIRTPESLLEEESSAAEAKECWIYSYCSATKDDDEQGPSSQAFRIGVAFRTSSDWLNHGSDHVGDIQLLGEDSIKIRGTVDFSGRRIGSRVNLSLANHWLYLCERRHGNWSLSYCWPPRDTLKALQSNIDALSQPGALRERRKEIPQAITDAIDIVLDLGERYLWVDALCIIQDSDEHQRKLIGQMNKIYSFADVTIVPVVDTMDGEIACAGFPRYNPHIKTRDQVIVVAQGLHITVAFEAAICPVNMATNRWRTRAWTYQECLLSNRILFFTCHQVYFQCRCHVFSEDCWGESATSRTFISPHTSLSNPGAPYNSNMKNFNDSLHLRTHTYESDVDAVLAYSIIVSEYKARGLSFSSDALRAFNGIQNILHQSLRTHFWFGMPERFWDAAILFVVADRGQYRRPEDLRNPLFPSWSWAGWNYVSAMGYFSPDADKIRKEVEWFLLSSRGSVMILKSQNPVVESAVSFPAEGNKNLGILSSKPPTDPNRLVVEAAFQKQLESPGISVRLACWTMLAELRVPRRAHSLEGRGKAFNCLQHLAICDDRDRWIGSIPMTRSWVQERTDTTQKYLFMVMSRSQDVSWSEDMARMNGSTTSMHYFDPQVFTDRPWCLLNGLSTKMDGWKRSRLRNWLNWSDVSYAV